MIILPQVPLAVRPGLARPEPGRGGCGGVWTGKHCERGVHPFYTLTRSAADAEVPGARLVGWHSRNVPGTGPARPC